MEEAMEMLSRETRELSLGEEIERVEAPMSPLRFLRDFVMPGKPCIVSGAIGHWGAIHRWSNDYLRRALGDHPVSVHFTPDGRADSIIDAREMEVLLGADDGDDENEHDVKSSSTNASVDNDSDDDLLVFATARVETMPFQQALDAVITGRTGNVAYLQQQNDCFRSEYSILVGDAEAHIPWATQALGAMPDAVNLWIGNENSVTSFHKDHYENLYAVVSGEKHFTLLPPVDVHRLYIRDYPSATYVRSPDGSKLVLKRDCPPKMVPWVSVDPYTRSHRHKLKFPKFFDQGDKPFRCTVRAGEILYLPSLWFHHVTQQPDLEGRTIAINFWYDMKFDVRYAYFNFLEACVKHRLKLGQV